MNLLVDYLIEFVKSLLIWIFMVAAVALCMWSWDIPIIGTGWWTGWEDPTWWQSAIWVGVLRLITDVAEKRSR